MENHDIQFFAGKIYEYLNEPKSQKQCTSTHIPPLNGMFFRIRNSSQNIKLCIIPLEKVYET